MTPLSRHADRVRELLPVSSRIAPQHVRSAGGGPVRIEWGPDVPPLPAGLAEGVETTWGVRVSTIGGAESLPHRPAFAAAYAHARAEQVLRALSAATNLTFAGARAVVAGAGPVAAAVAGTLTQMGCRVVVATGDDVAAVRFGVAGHEVVLPAAVADLAVDWVLVTGEGDRLDAARLSGVIADAGTVPGHLVLPPGRGEPTRAGVRRIGPHRWVVTLPEPLSGDTALDAHIADLVVAASLAEAVAGAGGDATLARELRS